LDSLNGKNHFLYGFDESLSQTQECPKFIQGVNKDIDITVEWRLK
jgi:hypothetical protein